MAKMDDHLAPLTDELLRLGCSGLGLPANPRVIDLCCGLGSAGRLLAREIGAVVTGIDLSDVLLRTARERALEEGLEGKVEFVHGDARHIEMPNHNFDLVLALGGALTYVGRPEGLERIRQLLKPGGALLFSDLVYLDSPAPADVCRVLDERAPGNPLAPLPLQPAVRAVFEEGVYRFENESSYRALLATFGYEIAFTFLTPESAWNAYYERVARSLLEPQPDLMIPVEPTELASFYSWGGRWGMGYLVCGARTESGGIDRIG